MLIPAGRRGQQELHVGSQRSHELADQQHALAAGVARVAVRDGSLATVVADQHVQGVEAAAAVQGDAPQRSFHARLGAQDAELVIK